MSSTGSRAAGSCPTAMSPSTWAVARRERSGGSWRRTAQRCRGIGCFATTGRVRGTSRSISWSSYGGSGGRCAAAGATWPGLAWAAALRGNNKLATAEGKTGGAANWAGTRGGRCRPPRPEEVPVSRRLVIAGVTAAALAGAVVPALASTGSPVTVDTSNGVAVGVHNGNTPIAGASVTPDGQACVGISLQLPVCTPGGIIGGIEATIPQQDGPVTNGTSNGVAVHEHAGHTAIAGAAVSRDVRARDGVSRHLPVCPPDVSPSGRTRQSLP